MYESVAKNISRGANGESAGRAVANRTFHGHISREMWRYTHFELTLASRRPTLVSGVPMVTVGLRVALKAKVDKSEQLAVFLT